MHDHLLNRKYFYVSAFKTHFYLQTDDVLCCTRAAEQYTCCARCVSLACSSPSRPAVVLFCSPPPSVLCLTWTPVLLSGRVCARVFFFLKQRKPSYIQLWNDGAVSCMRDYILLCITTALAQLDLFTVVAHSECDRELYET